MIKRNLYKYNVLTKLNLWVLTFYTRSRAILRPAERRERAGAPFLFSLRWIGIVKLDNYCNIISVGALFDCR